MYNLIEKYMERLTTTDVEGFALKNNIHLSKEELAFTYEFIKKNWSGIIANVDYLDINRYKDKYSPENFVKIEKLFKEYAIKFKNFL